MLWRSNLSNNQHPYVSEVDLINQYRPGSPLNDDEKKDLRRLYSQLALGDRTFNSILTESYDNPERLNPFPLYAYNSIWWWYYRDSNLIDDSQESNYVSKLSLGSNSVSWLRPRYCCFKKDYFTTAKLNPQSSRGNVIAPSGSFYGSWGPMNGSNPSNVVDDNYAISSNISSTGIPVQFLRAANAFLKILERDNIAGGRKVARLLAQMGVAPDAVRVDQPEYLGGNRFIMDIGGITSPSQISDAGTPSNPFIDSKTSMAGQTVGKGVIDGTLKKTIYYHAKEAGILMAISTLLPDIEYYQGLHKSWQYGVNNVKEDYLTPQCDCLGFEPIFNKELALCNLEEDSENNRIWGFSRRYGSWCFKNNIVSGDLVLKETRTGMEAFHLLRDFRASNNIIYAPALNPNFTMIVPAARHQFDRIFQRIGNNNEWDHFVGFYDCYCSSKLPKSPNQEPSLEEDSHSRGKQIQIDNGGTRF